MALAAHSFAGRLIAVLSRRSPAFRPPRPRLSTQAPHKRTKAATVLDKVQPNLKHFYLAQNTYGRIMEEVQAAEVALRRLQNSADHLSDATRMENRTTTQAAKKHFAVARSKIKEITNLNLSPLASSGEYRHRLITTHETAKHLSAVDAALRQATAPAHPASDDMALHLFMSRISELVRLLAYQCGECAVALSGPRFLGVAPRLERVRVTIARMKVLSEEAAILLDSVCDDYAGADLREVDISVANLSWLRWDEETKWPLAWAQQIRRMSIEVSPGHWIIQPVDTNEDLDLFV
ncbi:hypothetical protein [Streptomyces albogriseolus]|uniref:hypothetical protein n=1 Tax=Streptomyces albogriseolus TaxID=1887 RepID=UPI003820A749